VPPELSPATQPAFSLPEGFVTGSTQGRGAVFTAWNAVAQPFCARSSKYSPNPPRSTVFPLLPGA
jgi:hypothetical protein